LEAQRILREEARFTIQTDVISIILGRESPSFQYLGLATGCVSKLGLKVNVSRVIAGRIRIRDIRGDQFLADAQQVHISLELSGESVQHIRLMRSNRLTTRKPHNFNRFHRMARHFRDAVAKF
jgi:hypothetical protein